ncbi:MAG TPA: sulfite exporter TauE/SafE family protein [Planktothrix sp.]|jgi:hypothetical protein
MDYTIFYFIIVGFVAQLINCALGMAFGVLCTSLLLFAGLTPLAASASVHTAELFGTAASGFCHLRLGNVDKKLLRALLLPGIIGGALGACLLIHIPAQIIKPFISVFLLIMGVKIVWNILKTNGESQSTPKPPRTLGFVAGFLDAVGGGGWGSIATSQLVATGHSPRLVIGTVNFARFFITIVSSTVFFITLRTINVPVVLGLAIGAVLAAPVAAPFSKMVKPKALAVAVATLIGGLAVAGLYSTRIGPMLSNHVQLAGLQQQPWK